MFVVWKYLCWHLCDKSKLTERPACLSLLLKAAWSGKLQVVPFKIHSHSLHFIFVCLSGITIGFLLREQPGITEVKLKLE